MTAISHSDGPDRVRRLTFAAVLLVASVLLSFALAEIVVRAHLWSRPVSFHLANGVYGQYDARFGQQFQPNSRK